MDAQKTDYIKFPESKLAHKYLDGLRGIEIGGAAHNSFGLDTRNVDFTDDMDTIFKKQEIDFCGKAMPVDIVAHGDCLPLENESVDFVISSHVLEHFYDPIKAIKEWLRVTKPGGYVFMIVPHKERTFDKDRGRTKLIELIFRHSKFGSLLEKILVPENEHWSFWITEDVVKICKHMKLNIIEVQDVDDKVGNGFTVVIKK